MSFIYLEFQNLSIISDSIVRNRMLQKSEQEKEEQEQETYLYRRGHIKIQFTQTRRKSIARLVNFQTTINVLYENIGSCLWRLCVLFYIMVFPFIATHEIIRYYGSLCSL